MNIAAISLATGGMAVVGVTIVNYFRSIADAQVTVEIAGLVGKLLLGSGLAIAGVVWGVKAGALGAAVLTPAVLAVLMASLILWLLTQRRTPVGELEIEVGDKLLAFEAMGTDGSRFSSDELAGKRTLLKFFRGGW